MMNAHVRQTVRRFDKTWPLALIAGLLLLGGSLAADEASQGGAALEGNVEQPMYTLGFVEPSFDPPDLNIELPRAALSFPTRFDWREQGKISPIKDQGSCGACFCFATIGGMEASLLISDDELFDFSENNVKECEWRNQNGYIWSGCNGGHFWQVVSYLTEKGTALETCDPYKQYDGTCKECPYVKTVLDWRAFSMQEIPPIEVTKHYLQNYGPVAAAIDAGDNSAWRIAFTNYDGSYTLHYDGPGRVNHAVLIIGWDDTLSHDGGQGAWIVKNSWGTFWGGTAGYGTEGGYFTIAYGSAKLGWYSTFFREVRDYEPSDLVLLHDEAGFENYDGESTTEWGMCKFVAPSEAELERVELWTTDATTDIDVYVYDDFNGSTLSNLLSSQLDNSFQEMGYVPVVLDAPVSLTTGQGVYVAVKFSNATLDKPLAFDPKILGPWATGMCYRSADGQTWELFDKGDLGIRVRLKRDAVPPDTVSSFSAVGSDTTATLRWDNPSDPDFSHVLIRYSDSGYPTAPYEGLPVENGENGRFYGMPARSDSFVHKGLTNNTMYYYSAFAGDNIPNYAAPVSMTVTPEDSVPPGSVSDFAAFGSDRQVNLTWTNPEDIDVTGVLIAYSLDGPIDTPESGDPVENGNNGIFAAAPSQVGNFSHMDLINDTTYYYCIVAFDEVGNYSAPASTDILTNDRVPPTISISVFQNPYITQHLDIYVIGSEPLAEDSLTVTVNETEVAAEAAGPDGSIYRADYEIYASGALTIDVVAQDMNLNRADTSRTYNASRLLAESGGVLGSMDGSLILTVPEGTLAGDMFVLVSDASQPVGTLISTHEILPRSVELAGEAELSIAYDAVAGDPEHLCIARLDGDEVCLLRSYVDKRAGRLTAYVDRFGTYGLYRSDEVVSSERGSAGLRLMQNAPNPFSRTTRVAYEVTRPTSLKLEIISVEGRLVKTLWAGIAAAGPHQAEWDGTDESGRKVAGGVYLYRIKSQVGTLTRKMVFLH
jgi:C1A family cysteine protease